MWHICFSLSTCGRGTATTKQVAQVRAESARGRRQVPRIKLTQNVFEIDENLFHVFDVWMASSIMLFSGEIYVKMWKKIFPFELSATDGYRLICQWWNHSIDYNTCHCMHTTQRYSILCYTECHKKLYKINWIMEWTIRSTEDCDLSDHTLWTRTHSNKQTNKTNRKMREKSLRTANQAQSKCTAQIAHTDFFLSNPLFIVSIWRSLEILSVPQSVSLIQQFFIRSVNGSIVCNVYGFSIKILREVLLCGAK